MKDSYHPGVVFRKDVIDHLELSIHDVCARLNYRDYDGFLALLDGKVPLRPKDALRFGIFTNTSPMSWLAMQHECDRQYIERADMDKLDYAVNRNGIEIANLELEPYD